MQRWIVALSFAAAIASAHATTSLHPAEVELLGVWSFDGTCASGDGMTLKYDGKAAYDEWGQGLWALDRKDKRIVLIVEDVREDADRYPNAQLIEFRVQSQVGKSVQLLRASDGAKINATRCPGR